MSDKSIRIHVYTSTIGKTDPLQEPSIVAPGVRYYCLSDKAVKSNVWQRIEPANTRETSIMQARRFKLKLHDHAIFTDFYLWIDASFRLDVDPMIFLNTMLRFDIALLRHPDHNSVEEEASMVSRLRRALDASIKRQLKDYQESGLVGKVNGQGSMASSGFLLRRNCKRSIAFNEFWFGEFLKYGHSRDQMSIDYALKKMDMDTLYLQGDYRNNPYAKWTNFKGKLV